MNVINNKENLAKSLGAPGNSGAPAITLPQIIGTTKDNTLKSVKVVPGGNKLNLKASLVQQTGRG